ncbi:NUDIX domain-containing protein [Alicyclobacillus macrosporangiidus]|jgi:8-oxo-dGTP diphosphatase|uniref:8-oxo-dGTP diphosphatase n=1 Tax=Alicyclobacillus macrosporangiidus TaxID=392015 RepID=A0A1I7FS55_9BACL|nr:NUDIX domain-containing protein [Alicyclobacillus macrosporangiidus]SFU39049.1 8-oxo-dGTP diphosphatase [Alicyclobacillus macrosporangiidus]
MQQATALNLDPLRRHPPRAVLVFPVLCGRMLWVCHPVRGWEVPGGKLEPGETPEAAARREVWEETGATLRDLSWIAEYWVPDTASYKWVYVGIVDDWHARPPDSEILDVACRPGLPPPERLQTASGVSFVLKDEVYRTVYPILQRILQSHDG